MKNHLVLEKSWFIAIGTVSETGDDSREKCIHGQVRNNQNGIPTCVIKWKYPRLLISVMRLGLFVIYVTKTIRLRLLLVVGVVKFSYSTKYGMRDKHGKEKSFIFLVHTKRNAEDGVLSFNVILYNSRV